MKRRYIAIFVMGLAMWLCACETEMMGYEGESGIYFMMQKAPASGYGDLEQYEYVDTTLIPFAMFTAKDTVLPIRVRIIGDVADHDRYFTIRVVDTLTTAISRFGWWILSRPPRRGKITNRLRIARW